MAKMISEIYTEYKIMPNLQEHMLRVAAVASIICDNFDEFLPKNDIITACLLHDMGNIIKSNLEILPEFLEPEGRDYWQKVKNEYIGKYGEDEHKATLEIMRELGAPSEIIELVDKIGFSLLCEHRDADNLIHKIISYSDGRVDPYGIVSYDERMEEAKKRYQNNKDNKRTEEERLKSVACGEEIEKQIFSKCKIKPEDINNETVAPVILSLKEFVIHSAKNQDW
jgi:hypothetical protein